VCEVHVFVLKQKKVRSTAEIMPSSVPTGKPKIVNRGDIPDDEIDFCDPGPPGQEKVRNKFIWKWMEKFDVRGEHFSSYMRKVKTHCCCYLL
jgi:hypothetical protein